MKVRISRTARQSGYGKDRWKKVLGLTPEEKNLILSDREVYLCFRADRLSGGNHGTLWRYVEPRHSGKYFNPRVPPESVLNLLSQMEEK